MILGDLSVDVIRTLLKKTLKINSDEPDFKQLLSYSLRYKVFFITCLTFAVIMPWVGIIVFCVRNIGPLGGTRYETYRPNRGHERRKCGLLALFFSFMLGYGAIFGHICNFNIVFGIDNTNQVLTNHLKDVTLYLDSSFQNIEHYFQGSFVFISKVIHRDLWNIGVILGGDAGSVLKQGSGHIQKNNVDFATNIGRIMTETLTLGPLLLNMTGNGSRLGKAKSLSSVLAVALKEQADTIRSVQNDTSLCPAAPALCGALNASQLDLNVDFNEMPDIDDNWKRLNKIILNQGQFQRALSKTIRSLDMINYRLELNAPSLIRNYEKMAKKYEDLVQRDMLELRRLQDRTKLGLAFFKSKLDMVIGLARENSMQWWSLGVVLFSVTTVIVVLQLLAVFIGTVSNWTDGLSTKRTLISDKSGNLLIFSTKLIFIISWLLVLTASVSFPVSCIFQKVFCDPLVDKEQTVIKQLLDGPDSKVLGNKGYYFGDLILSDNSQDVTLSDMILRCSLDQPIIYVLRYDLVFDVAKTAAQLYKLVNIAELLQPVSVKTDDMVLLDTEADSALEDIEVGIGINYSKFINMLSKSTMSIPLSDFSDSVRLAAADSGTTGDARTRLYTVADHLIVIEKKELSTVAKVQKTFLQDFNLLQFKFDSMPDSIAKTKVAIGKVETDLKGDIISEPKKRYKNRLNKVLRQYWPQALHVEETGRCGSLYKKHRQLTEIGICTNAITPFHGYWLSLLWSAMFMTICIVINFKLSRHYLLMELADQTEIQKYDPMAIKELVEPPDEIEGDLGMDIHMWLYMTFMDMMSPFNEAADYILGFLGNSTPSDGQKQPADPKSTPLPPTDKMLESLGTKPRSLSSKNKSWLSLPGTSTHGAV
ncbi:hypothetical protein LSAT2_025495 [Lamellibrachia satsuma]|nr:hypothetical protein LSAT2_025495 [Lamellibrachia satsuma]